jgi:Tfp pilus assembly pilus retraction ATPase PilT
VPALPEGRALAVEHFENQAVTRKWISEGKFRDLADFIGKGDNPTNTTFLESLVGMIHAGRITEDTAMHVATNPREIQRRLRGVNSSNSPG